MNMKIPGKMNLCIKYKDDYPEIELWNFERRKALFEEVYNKKIEVTAEECSNT